MKKLFALVLAVAMVLSLASVAMANSFGTTNNPVLVEDADGKLQVQYDDTSFYKWDGDNKVFVANNGTTPYGKTIYIQLLDSEGNPVTKNDAVSGLKVTAKWTQNGKYVKSVEIVKKGGQYMIAINTQGSETKEKDVVGTITVTGKGYATGTDYKEDKKYSTKKTEIDVELNLKFASANEGDAVPENGAFYEFSEWDGDEEEEITFEKDDDVSFTVDTTHQGDLVLAMNTDENEAVTKLYPSANLDFYNFNGATFRKTGTLLIPAEEGQFIYEVKDGALQAVNAKYDSFEEAFTIKTKTLGQYVLSDVELAVGTAVAPAEAAAATPVAVAANPSTGAAL